MIRIDHLTCGYGSKIVLDNITLEIHKGEFVGIIGPNGSGKTTIMRAITRLIKPITGTIYLEGINVSSLDYKELAQKIAVVSQNFPVMAMSVREFVLLGRIPYYNKFQFLESEKDLAIAENAMVMTDMIKLEDSYMSEMSSGEVQLAFIARAITQEPSLLLLDEPTAHLDITHQVGVLDLIKRLNRQYGLTVLIVLHDLNLASEYCDRLVLMNQGQIENTGRPEEVLTYGNIEKVYNTVVVVEKNPISGKPFVLVVSEEVKRKCER
ncbi:MAG: ABC transporter ATP-binding protein [Syntrophus sp. (in: bacteria)]|nr:ABC transporter ATP-binding protein [Syntrophus sp. (in: bacteria)]